MNSIINYVRLVRKHSITYLRHHIYVQHNYVLLYDNMYTNVRTTGETMGVLCYGNPAFIRRNVSDLHENVYSDTRIRKHNLNLNILCDISPIDLYRIKY